MPTSHSRTIRGIATAILAAMALPALAADDAEIRAQIDQLRAQQAEIARLQRDNEAALRALEARLGVAGVAPATPPATVASATPSPAAQSAPASASTAAAPAASRLKLSGDLRVRAQHDTSDSDRPNRSSAQLRARLGASWRVNDLVSIGAHLVTGDGDDPNSVDVQLSNWDDDLAVSLDQAWLQLNFGDLKLFGGKMPQPFARTELVWDGDVNPQGIAATWRHARADGSAWRANGLFFLVDERVAGADSTMLGVQLGHDTRAFGDWKFDASLALYDYSLKSIAGADSGDWRTNLLNPDGTYLSDFRLVDAIVGATWSGLGERWPLRLVGDVVRNTGARTDGDRGHGLDLVLGRASQVGDWRISVGHATAGVDAVLAAFSQDNIGIATNYRLHSLGVDYVPWPNTTLSAILYRYRPDAAAYAGSNDPHDWLNRARVSLMVGF